MPDRQRINEAVSKTAGVTPPDDAASAPVAPTVDRRPWQFSLRALMLFTAVVAGVVWLATVKGAGVLVVVTGLAVSLLNRRGALAAWQTPERCGRPIKLGWLLLLVSLLLPSVVIGCNNNRDNHAVGWQVAWACAVIQGDGIGNGSDPNQERLNYIFITSLNLINLSLLASPLFLLLLRRGRGQGYAGILACGATIAWTIPVPDASGVLIGYDVWCVGQLMVLSAARLGPRTLAAMVVVAFVRVFLWPEP
ncbi:MAG TPA: hypothetical protein VMV69_03615 [Pirellulales bacterium]|nr:hypothetical protein [Pirellulales bacterium]